MAVYRRGKTWWYSFQFNGETIQESAKTRNKRTAEQIEAKARTDRALGLHGLLATKPGPPLETFKEEFLKHVRTRNADHPQTVKFYEEKARRLVAYRPLAECRINLINESLIDQYVQERKRDGMAVASINRELATLRRLLRFACNTKKLVTRVPVISLLPGERNRQFVLDYEQEKAYLAIAEDTLRDFAKLSLDTGVRAGEGISLAWDDVHIEGKSGYITIRAGKSENAKRSLALSPRCVAMLENRREFGPKNVYVFQSPYWKKAKPMTVSYLDQSHGRARKIARLEDGKELPAEFVVHSLRHTFGTRLGASGADAFEIMRIMGHSSVTVSQKYVHPTAGNIERAFARLESLNAIMRGDPAKVSTVENGSSQVTETKERP